MEEKFLAMIRDVFEIEDRSINMGDNFRDYDEWDSLARLSLIAEIDDMYDIVIEDTVFKELQTLDQLYGEIQKRANV